MMNEKTVNSACEYLHHNWRRLQDDIASLSNGRTRLMAVAKNQPIDSLKILLESGQTLFGENRVQEAQAHWQALKPLYPQIRLHLIGPLQRNKVRPAVALFDVIETLDTPQLARALATEMKAQNRFIPVFIQVNIGNETQKSGCAVDEIGPLLKIARSEGLDVTGLMAIPPAADAPKPYFEQLKRLVQIHGLAECSMGMSADYRDAIESGSTIVRLGTVLFGHRTD